MLTGSYTTTYILDKVGFLGGRIGRYEIGGGHKDVTIKNAVRSFGRRHTLKANVDAEMVDDLGKQEVLRQCSEGFGVLAEVRVLPDEWLEPAAAAGEPFKARVKEQFKQFLFFPKIKKAGCPVGGFEFSMAEATTEEMLEFTGGIDPEFRPVFIKALDRVAFIDPNFIESTGSPELNWVKWFGYITGSVMANLMFDQFAARSPRSFSVKAKRRVVETFALKHQHAMMLGYIKGTDYEADCDEFVNNIVEQERLDKVLYLPERVLLEQMLTSTGIGEAKHS